MASVHLTRRISLLDAISLVMGSIIGAGIFAVPNLVARQLKADSAILSVWVFAGLLTLAGGLAYAELGAMMPSSGGQYGWLRDAFGPLAAFLCGWTYFLVIIPAAIAFLGITFAIYLGQFLPLGEVAQKLVAIALITGLSAVNYRGVAAGARLQTALTFVKAAGIITLVAAAMLHEPREATHQAAAAMLPAQFGLAMIACLLTYDGWVTLAFAAGEVRNPRRNLPLGLLIGIGLAIAIYTIANFAYLRVMPPQEMAVTARVGARVAELSIGSAGGAFLAGLVLFSIAGAMNGWILAAPRLYYAQASDGLFFSRFAELHPRFRTPVFGIVVQSAWASLLCLTGTYETLGGFAMFAAWIFYGATVVALFVFRRKWPDRERPYRCWGYPVVPALFVALAVAFVGNTLYSDPRPAASGLAIILAGVPAYALWRRRM